MSESETENNDFNRPLVIDLVNILVHNYFLSIQLLYPFEYLKISAIKSAGNLSQRKM